jgi:P-type Ca2+ transporter type 2C
MILWNNLIIDVVPSFALALEPGREDAMREPPRRKDDPILGRRISRRSFTQGVLIAAVGLTAHFWAVGPMNMNLPQAQAATFVTVTAAQLLVVFNARSHTGSGFVGASRNPYLWFALGITVLLPSLALGYAPLRDVLGLETLTSEGWWAVVLPAPLPLLTTQTTTRLLRSRNPGAALCG